MSTTQIKGENIIFTNKSDNPIITLKAEPGKTLEIDGSFSGPLAGSGLVDGKILIGDSSNEAIERNMSGDATMDNTGTLTLANVNASPGSYVLPSLTTNAKGQITTVGELTGTAGQTITFSTLGNPVVRTIGGDLTSGGAGIMTLASTISAASNVPLPTITYDAKGRLTSVSQTTLPDSNIWIGSGSNLASAQAVSGDVTLSNTGLIELVDTGIVADVYTNPVIETDSKGRIIDIYSGSPSTVAGGFDTQIQYNNGGVLASTIGMTWNSVSSKLSCLDFTSTGVAVFSQFRAENGDAIAPSISFRNSAGSGLYLSNVGTAEISHSCGNVQIYKINSTATTFVRSTASTTTTTGAVVVTGGVGVGGQATINNASITASTASTTTGTGALVVTGGLGVGGQATINNASITASTASTTTSSGALIVTGGLGVGGQATINNASITSTTANSTTTNGALVVAGGVGIGGQLTVTNPFGFVSGSFAQNLPAVADTQLSTYWNGATTLVASMAFSSGVFTVPTTGIYNVTIAAYPGGSAHTLWLTVDNNNSTNARIANQFSTAANGIVTSMMLKLNASQNVRAMIYSGVSENMSTGFTGYFSIYKMG